MSSGNNYYSPIDSRKRWDGLTGNRLTDQRVRTGNYNSEIDSSCVTSPVDSPESKQNADTPYVKQMLDFGTPQQQKEKALRTLLLKQKEDALRTQLLKQKEEALRKQLLKQKAAKEVPEFKSGAKSPVVNSNAVGSNAASSWALPELRNKKVTQKPQKYEPDFPYMESPSPNKRF